MEANQTTDKRPLAGMRVIEVGQLLAGPFTGTILGYFGAEVIKVEPPETGDPIRRWRKRTIPVEHTSENIEWPCRGQCEALPRAPRYLAR